MLIIKRMKQTHTRRGEIDDIIDEANSTAWKKYDHEGNEIVQK